MRATFLPMTLITSTAGKTDSKKTSNNVRRGAALIPATLGLTAMLGFASFAVDYGRVRYAKSELRAVADAARWAAGRLARA